MKLIHSFIILAVFMTGISLNAQEVKEEKDKSVKEVTIKTSAQCGECKERIEKGLTYEKGVKFVELDLETKAVTVKYRADKTSEDALKKAISKLGYDADDVEADPEAYAKLPTCCQKGGHD